MNIFGRDYLKKELRHWERALEHEVSSKQLICPFCQELVGKEDVICSQCHRDLKINCSSCGAIIRVEWHRCPQCNSYID